ncbi:Nuclear pore complex protein Nup98-Nup96 [Durusdinium trenchii]|uniref:Nuclear pore complex protein Nup98-Nup96 n=1 Tax=Durusdinium trenchii TaxID=1381693 RepID=A0ABP0JIC7_9DINO
MRKPREPDKAVRVTLVRYYQWSNDNYLYTELAHPGLHEVDDTVLVFFAGEKPPLDNSLVAWVKISRDLQNSSVLSPGEEEIGGFYTFGGSFSEQTNRGISFLTSYTDLSQSVSRLKTAAINGQIVLLWEIWSSSSYNRTEFMVIDTKGQIQGSWPLTSLSFPFELPFADDVVVKNGRVVTYVARLHFVPDTERRLLVASLLLVVRHLLLEAMHLLLTSILVHADDRTLCPGCTARKGTLHVATVAIVANRF